MSSPHFRDSARIRTFAAILLAALIFAPQQISAGQSSSDIGDATLEDLMNMQVTSASRREQRAADVSAAVFVITAEEIRASGVTLVPELLRLSPGVSVARIDANKWAVTIRGFNGRWSDKLLVMVDGRTVYNRLFSGVFWESLALPVDSIERIEIVRGPGGSVWGTNAINGVINILTKSAKDTPGLVVEASTGTQDARGIEARYGGGSGATHYRLGLQTAGRGHSLFDPSFVGADDSWTTTGAGFRVDHEGTRDAFTVQGDGMTSRLGSFQAGTEGPVGPADGWASPAKRARFVSGNVLARWTRTLSPTRSVQVQGFTDLWRRNDPQGDSSRALTFDADIKFQTMASNRHAIVTGAGFRNTAERTDPSFLIQMDPAQETSRVFNAFAQDEVRLFADRIRLTAGTKVEYNTHYDWSLQPTGRVLWAPHEHHRVWAAFSRAVRTPGRIDRGVRVNISSSYDEATGLPVLVSYVGNKDYQPEETRSSEFGYRVDLGRFMLDGTAFVNHHEGLRLAAVLAPEFESTPAPAHLLLPIIATNGPGATARGFEAVGRWAASTNWHVDAHYSFISIVDKSPDAPPESANGLVPRHQARVESSWRIGPRLTAGASVGRVGALAVVPAHTRADARLELKLTPSWSAIAAGQNLFDASHYEFIAADNPTEESLDPRRFSIRLRGTF